MTVNYRESYGIFGSSTVRDFVSMAFKGAGIDVEFRGKDADETAVDLGWKPETTLEQLCQMMVEADLKRNLV
ncbi:hypothetical protein AEA01_17435 [Xanthomonas campestris pv. campestris]|nr:hypothetical protein AEA01_17435 [Xanthomonas campestris pv. campestris]